MGSLPNAGSNPQLSGPSRDQLLHDLDGPLDMMSTGSLDREPEFLCLEQVGLCSGCLQGVHLPCLPYSSACSRVERCVPLGVCLYVQPQHLPGRPMLGGRMVRRDCAQLPAARCACMWAGDEVAGHQEGLGLRRVCIPHHQKCLSTRLCWSWTSRAAF